MDEKTEQQNLQAGRAYDTMRELFVAGFKSIRDRQRIAIAPLTLLAGVNSSGKSSMIQPLLLLKQTVESLFEPGALKLDGLNVRFTSPDQFFSKSADMNAPVMTAGGLFSNGIRESVSFQIGDNELVELLETSLDIQGRHYAVRSGMSVEDILQNLPDRSKSVVSAQQRRGGIPTIDRDRSFHILVTRAGDSVVDVQIFGGYLAYHVRRLIHVSANRTPHERTYPVAGTGPTFPGTFEVYTGSLIAEWESKRDARLEELNANLRLLDLTRRAIPRRVNGTNISLLVDRLPPSAAAKKEDMVSVADVGFGVSQVLPVLVALQIAEPGQLVYIEEPELHLHPRAQARLAEILAVAAKRDIRLVIETHSALLLLALQTLVAEGSLDPNLVCLHWFNRDADGVTQVTTAELDEAGRFGDWPEDFGAVALEAESRYLDAVESRHARE